MRRCTCEPVEDLVVVEAVAAAASSVQFLGQEPLLHMHENHIFRV
jgi:hypothetical protein